MVVDAFEFERHRITSLNYTGTIGNRSTCIHNVSKDENAKLNDYQENLSTHYLISYISIIRAMDN